MSVRVTNLLAPLLIEVALLLLHDVLRPLPLQRRDHLVRVRARARVGGWGLGLGLGLGLVLGLPRRRMTCSTVPSGAPSASSHLIRVGASGQDHARGLG